MVVEGNVGLAFGLVIAAGLCTCLGATMVFCTNVANHKVLSGALGASAGVMTYVSFVEIFGTKAITSFMEAGFSANEAARYATFAFFTGVIATWILGKFTHWLAHVADVLQRRKDRRQAANNLPNTSNSTSTAASTATVTAAAAAAAGGPGSAAATVDLEQGSSAAAIGSHADGGTMQQESDIVLTTPPTNEHMLGAEPNSRSSRSSGSVMNLCDSCDHSRPIPVLEIPKAENPEMVAVLQADQHTTDLARMGLLTGLAVGLHNLPEGLATFVATLASPSAGIAIAVAIALHNIPEGVVVAMPIYYATKSKWKGFLWSFVSGVAEPVGGLVAYLILASNGMSPLAFAVMFAFVAGMMVFISMRELLPTALRYDPEDCYATSACLWGMAIMAASLLLFKV